MKIAALILAFVLFLSIGYAQKIKSEDVSQAVKTAFQKQFPDVSKVSWSKEEKFF